MSNARAFWTVAPGRGEIRAESLPEPGPHDVVVRARFSGISRGTEALVFAGRVPASERERMRAPFQTGSLPGPVKYGYASVGDVEAGPASLVGARVFVLYPHQTRYVVPAGAVHVIPDAVPSHRAVLAANLETAVNALWDGQPAVGARVAVIGAGVVGCLVAWLARQIPGAQVQLVDVNADRSAVARALGVEFAEPSGAVGDADLVVHTSSTSEGLVLALRLAGFEATVLELSWFGTLAPAVPLGEAFHARRLVLRSSQVGTVSGTQRARWDSRRRLTLALHLLADPVLDVLVSGESDFETLPSVMPTLASPGPLCHRIRYGPPSSQES